MLVRLNFVVLNLVVTWNKNRTEDSVAKEEDAIASHTAWRQGDYALDCGPLILRGTCEPDNADDEGVIYDDNVEGFVVVSQTCDIVRDLEVVPMVSVCPLVRVPEDRIRDIERGIAPRLANVAGAPDAIVADLSRTMTVHKALLATWGRQRGCRTEEEQRTFAFKLERVFGRFAFPSEFVESIREIRKIILEKHNKANSPIGKILRSIKELRVVPDPGWSGPGEVHVSFIVILERTEGREESDREKICDEMTKIIKKATWNPPFFLGELSFVTLADITAEEYVASYGLEVNDLSGA